LTQGKTNEELKLVSFDEELRLVPFDEEIMTNAHKTH
jgi:hypothetical protein